ncbi:class I SAM-dependent methyltransferase [Planotetraspora kaengkrachanensis]|uniref:Methyltransferase type 11 n=1 Tax=Planotetraspora kaengkrachanensis TaxID=575193 RepID=A0A8J3PTY2_9ACTN|nr:class I SAM-dependent methyltransferase [Planotetraspora kaengkrachanensis]GIG80993.1 methyltransferase type 11 [Planotetraspora kaengkrachanensis]
MTSENLHLDRQRAGSFGSVADQYDRYRPACPDALIEDLVALRPEHVLDVACGTGKVAVPLTKRGLSVLGVEPDERMAELARDHGLQVEISPFETWDDAGRRFDLITCGSAWHWIDPDRGARKAAAVLRPGGVIARFWSYHLLEKPVLAAFDAVYGRLAPDAEVHGRIAEKSTEVDPFAESAEFSSVETRKYRWEATLSADEWVGLVATYSDHQRLGSERLAAVQRALREVIEDLGGVIRSHGETYVLFARRLPAPR